VSNRVANGQPQALGRKVFEFDSSYMRLYATCQAPLYKLIYCKNGINIFQLNMTLL